MYIDPFAAGVITTIFVEIVLLVGFSIYLSYKNHNKED